MSDVYYRERAARRKRLYLLIAALIGVPLCLYAGISRLYHDNCTDSYDRSPEAVVRSFLDMMIRGDDLALTRCWTPDAFYDLEAGCSDICLQRAVDVPYEIVEIQVGKPYVSEAGRSAVEVTVTLACPDGARHTGIVTLDAVRAELPWRHWKIARNTVFGSVAEQWCNR